MVAANSKRGITTSLSPNTLHRVAANRAKGLAIRQQKLAAATAAVTTAAVTLVASPDVPVSQYSLSPIKSSSSDGSLHSIHDSDSDDGSIASTLAYPFTQSSQETQPPASQCPTQRYNTRNAGSTPRR